MTNVARIAIALSLAVALAWGIVRLRARYDAIDRTVCNGHLFEIGTAMHSYHEKYGHFPPAYLVGADGAPQHSWRVLLLEFLDPTAFAAYRFDEAWDGPNNRRLADKMPDFCACPSDAKAASRGQTNYFVVVGPSTLFPGAESTAISDIQRPLDETILVVEATGNNIDWMAPRDLGAADLRVDSASTGDAPRDNSISSGHSRPNVCLADGSRLSVVHCSPSEIQAMVDMRPRTQTPKPRPSLDATGNQDSQGRNDARSSE